MLSCLCAALLSVMAGRNDAPRLPATFAADGAVQAWPVGASKVPANGTWFRAVVNGDSAVSVELAAAVGDTQTFVATYRNGCRSRASYWGDDQLLNLRWSFWCQDSASFPKGLSLRFPASVGPVTQRTSAGLWLPPDQSWGEGDDLAQLTPRVRFPGPVEVCQPNAFHSFWRLKNSGAHALDILPLWKEATPIGQGTASCPRLRAGDTLQRFLQVRADTSLKGQVSLSEHPFGYSSSLMWYFDDLPNRDAWAPISRTQFPLTCNSNIPHLLDLHPRAKLGWVLVMDRMYWKRTPPVVEGWSFGTAWAFRDTVAAHAGKAQLLLWAPAKDSTVLSTRFVLKGTGKIDVGAWIGSLGATGNLNVTLKAIEHRRITNAVKCAVKRAFWSTTLAVTPASRGGGHWEVARDTADTVELSLSLPSTDSPVLLDEVYLTQGGEVLNPSTGGFEGGRELGVLADTARRHWSDFHGPEHLASRAPASYISFLQSLSRHEGMEGWESRTYLGSHGYHHDPSLREPDPAHEYERNEARHLQLTQSRMFSEQRSLDLYPWVSRFIRTPGMAYTGPDLNSFADSGMVFCDVGQINHWKAGTGYSPSYRHVERDGRRMWGIACAWWSDGWPTDASAQSPQALDSALTHRRSVVAGGHPESTFLNKLTWAAYDGLLTGLEARYPGMGYLSPTEWADHANAGAALDVAPLVQGKGLVLRGSVRAGQSVVLEGGFSANDTLVASFDGIDVPTRMDYPSCYAVLPEAPAGLHRVVFQPKGISMAAKKRTLTGASLLRENRDVMGRHLDAKAHGAVVSCPVESDRGCMGRILLGSDPR